MNEQPTYMERRLESNVRKFYLFCILSRFVFYYSVDILLMASRGLSVTDIVIAQVVYLVTKIILEVPSGALADRWSRKYVLALNMVFFVISTVLWAIAPNLGVFIIAMIIASIHSALRSGTDTAFLYDTLKQLGKSDDYVKTQGSVIFWVNLFSIVAGIAGGMIADAFGLAVPVWLTLPFACTAIIIALTFTEPKIHRTTGEMGFWKHIGVTGRILLKRQYLILLLSLAVVFYFSLSFMEEYGQLYYVGVGMPVFTLGYLAAVGSGVKAISSKFSYKLERFKRKTVFVSALVISAIGCIIVGLTKSWIGVPFTFLPWVAFYFTHPLIMADFYAELPSSQRATGGSFLSIMNSLVTVPIAFGFGAVADRGSINTAYFAIGILVAAFLVLFLFSYRGNDGNSQAEE